MVLLFTAIFMHVSLFSIVYWMLFGSLVGLLVVGHCHLRLDGQFNFNWFRKLVFLYWTVVIIYSSVVLISIYLFNFEDVPQWFQNVTTLNKDDLADIGLDETSSGQLLLKLLVPIAFFFVAVMQLKVGIPVSVLIPSSSTRIG